MKVDKMSHNINARYELCINEHMARIQDLRCREILAKDTTRRPSQDIPSLTVAFDNHDSEMIAEYVRSVLNRLIIDHEIEDEIFNNQDQYDITEIITSAGQLETIVCIKPYEVDIDTMTVQRQIDFDVDVKFETIKQNDNDLKVANVTVSYEGEISPNNLLSAVFRCVSSVRNFSNALH